MKMYFRRLAAMAVGQVAAFLAFLPMEAQVSLYVSPAGSADGNGSMDAPYRCIEDAQAAARNVPAAEVTIWLRGGSYQLEHPLVFTAEDTGGERKMLCIRSYPGEQAVLTSGVPLSLRWETHKGGVVKARVHQRVMMDMLLVNGELRPMARYPNYDSAAVRLNGVAADAADPKRVKRWKHFEGGYLHAMHGHDWGDFHYRITGKDSKGELILEGGWQNNRPSRPHPQNRMVENILEELDAPGEWYYDSGKGCLYYYPLPGEKVEQLRFETPQLKHLVEFRGCEERPVRNITLQGLKFTQTVRTFMEEYEPLLRSDWRIYRGGAVLLEGTEGCRIADCDFHLLGGNAVFFSGYHRNSSVSGCLFEQIGASAVCMVGKPEAVRSPSFSYGSNAEPDEMDFTPGPKTEEYPSRCVVSDNLIHHIGLFEKQVAGVELSMCSHILVSHNTIYDVPRAGINVSEGTWGGHRIVYNDVFNTVLETGDHGAFNSWGRDRFWSSSNKRIRQLLQARPDLVLADAGSCTTLACNRFRCDRGWDIDLDDGSSNYHIYNNLCLNGGIKLREGFYRVVENNIMVNNTFHPHVWFPCSGDVFVRNLVMSPYRPIGISHWGAEVDYNVFADSTAYRAARGGGTDEHSVVYVPEFVNPEEGDFRLANVEELASLCGFKNFGMDDFGVTSPRLKALAARPPMPLPAVCTEGNGIRVWEWSGLRLKTLDTLGERSATGMDSERGVYVVSVHAMGSPLRDFIRPNDVILRLSGKPVNRLEDLQEIVQAADWTKPQEVTVFREQREQSKAIPAGTLRKP